eukprot:4632621-Prymnesium_polylepis.2
MQTKLYAGAVLAGFVALCVVSTRRAFSVLTPRTVRAHMHQPSHGLASLLAGELPRHRGHRRAVLQHRHCQHASRLRPAHRLGLLDLGHHLPARGPLLDLPGPAPCFRRPVRRAP